MAEIYLTTENEEKLDLQLKQSNQRLRQLHDQLGQKTRQASSADRWQAEKSEPGLFMQEEDSDITLCRMCARYLKSPKTLPCLHMFCSQCFEDHLKTELNCPACKTELTSKDVQSLIRNHVVQLLVCKNMLKSPGKVMCEMAAEYCGGGKQATQSKRPSAAEKY